MSERTPGRPVPARSAGLRPASRPQAAKPHPPTHPHGRNGSERRPPAGTAAAGREPHPPTHPHRRNGLERRLQPAPRPRYEKVRRWALRERHRLVSAQYEVDVTRGEGETAPSHPSPRQQPERLGAPASGRHRGRRPRNALSHAYHHRRRTRPRQNRLGAPASAGTAAAGREPHPPTHPHRKNGSERRPPAGIAAAGRETHTARTPRGTTPKGGWRSAICRCGLLCAVPRQAHLT